MSDHTKEPWIAVKENGGWIIYAAGNFMLADLGYDVKKFNVEQNARRIVAAVNACAGIETYALELMTGDLSILNQIIFKTKGNLTPKATIYRQERDKLSAENAALFALLADIRIACGDYGQRRQDELVAHIAQIHQRHTAMLSDAYTVYVDACESAGHEAEPMEAWKQKYLRVIDRQIKAKGGAA